MKRYSTIGLFLFSILACSGTLADSKPVQVFILAGQSNMEGKAAVTTLDAVIEDPKTTEKYTHLKDGDGWTKRDDVFVTFLDRNTSELAPGHGPLSVGFGSPRGSEIRKAIGETSPASDPNSASAGRWERRSMPRCF